MLTLKKLKQKIKELEESGKIDDNTVVCGFNDEFCHLYALDDDHKIIKDVKPEIEDVEHYISYLKEQKDRFKPTFIDEKIEEVERLKSLGEYVVCLV